MARGKKRHIHLVILCLAVIAAGGMVYAFLPPGDPELAAMKALYERDDEVVYPLRNPYSEAKYELGKMLFFDPRLSDTNAISCATCHNPVFHWTDSHRNARGKGHEAVARKSMSLLNLAWDDVMLWDGREDGLEAQVGEAMDAPRGMSNDPGEVVAKLHAISGYRKLFREAFEKERPEYAENDYVNLKTIKAAIATFERGIISGTAPFDAWIEGDEDAISESAKRGFVLFNTKAKCATCHSGWRFSDGKYYNIGLAEPAGKDIGHAVTDMRDPEAAFAFKAVGLRNIAERPPYMHNGMFDTLEEVIEFYDRGGDLRRENTAIEPLQLSDQEKQDLVAFLRTLTSDDPEITLPYLPPNTP